MKHLKQLFVFALLAILGLGQMWADPVVLFHETFGNNENKARAWDDSYSVKSGVSAVYSGITSYTVSNVKQGKNTTGSTGSGLNQSSQGTDAYIIFGPLSVANYESLAVTYQWKAASTGGTYTAKLYYATSSTGDYTEVTGTGNGATSFVERSFSLPEAAQVSTLYLKAVWNTSNTQGIIDEFELTGVEKEGGDDPGTPEPTCSKEPTVTFATAEPEAISVGDTYTNVASVAHNSTATGQTIAYSSSNTAVATVDASTGEVTAVKAGTVTITATAAEDGDYCEAEESYELTINAAPDSQTQKTINLAVDETTTASESLLTWVGTYLTVSVSKSNASTATNNYCPPSQTSTRFYKNSYLVISPNTGYVIDNIEFSATSEGYASALQSSTWTNATAALKGESAPDNQVVIVTASGAGAVSAVIGNTCGFTQMVINYHHIASSAVTIANPDHGTITVMNGQASVSSGTNIDEGTTLTVSGQSNNAAYAFGTISAYKTDDQSTVVAISEGALTMPAYPITITADETQLFTVALQIVEKDNEDQVYSETQGNAATIDGGTVAVYKANTETVTLVATPDSKFNFVGWSANTESITFDDVTKANGAIATIGAAGTITATFKEKACTKLATPSVSVTDKTYSGAKLTWTGIEHADKYKVYIYNADKSAEIEHNDAFEGTTYTIGETLSGNTTYAYTVQAISNTPATYCESVIAESTFTTEDYPAATLTLSEVGGDDYTYGESLKINSVIALPSALTYAGCSGKVLVGWTTNASFADTDSDPTGTAGYYAKGANYTMATTADKLYAVYATAVNGDWTMVEIGSITENDVIVVAGMQDGSNYYGLSSANGTTSSPSAVALTVSSNTITAGVTDAVKWNLKGTAGNYILYANGTTDYLYNTAATTSTSGTNTAWRVGKPTEGTIRKLLKVNGTTLSTNEDSNERFLCQYNNADWRGYVNNTSNNAKTTIAFFKAAVSYTAYTINCQAALPKVATPTFSVASGTLEEETDITISIPDGATVYYTMTDDGTEPEVPTNASTQYTQKITLSDNGTYKFKAIAIKSGCEDSDVATATYTVDKAFTTIADFIANGSTTDVKKLILTGAVVLGKSGKNIYVQDATGAIILYNNDANNVPAWESGKEISGYVTGKKGTYNDMPEVTACVFSNASAETTGTLPEATIITEATNENLCKLVKIEGVKFQSTQLTSSAVTVVKGETSYTVYNSFGVLVQTLPNSATSCDVTGVLNKYDNAYQISPVSVDGISTGSPKAAAILPTVSDESGEVAKDKVVVVTPLDGMTTTLKIGDAEAQTITSATNITIDVDKSIVVTASAYYYTAADKTYTYTVNESLTEHNITIDANIQNGTVAADKTSAAEGTKITLTATPVNSHFTLGNWNVTYVDGESVEQTITPDANNQFDMPAYAVNVSATFNEDVYATIVFDGNGATRGSVENGKVYVNEFVTMPANGYAKTNGKFVGWEKDETVYAVGDQTYQVTEEGTITFYAKWDELPDFAAGDWTLVTDAAELTAGSYVIIAAANANKAMKSFESGSNCKSEDATKTDDMLEYDEDFGIFEIGDYEISNVTYKTFQDAETDQYLFIGSNDNQLKAQDTKNENAAWTITNVSNTGVAVVTSKSQSSRTIRYNSNNDLFACYASGQAAIALYKYYTPSYKLTYDKNLDAVVTNLPERKSVDSENKVTVSTSVPQSAEYIFTGWNAQADGKGEDYTANQELTLDGNKIIYAQWRPVDYYTISYDADDGTSESPIANEDIKEGTLYTVKANVYEKEGFLFTGWLYNEQTYQAGNQFTPTEDVTFVAQWSVKSNCTITLYVNGVPQASTILVEQGSSYDLSQITAPESINGYEFYGWAEAPETDDVDAISIISEFTPSADETAKSLYAVFKREEAGSNKTDVLTADDFAATSSSYAEFSNVQKVTSAKYAGKTSLNGTNIQINEKSKQGIYSSVSGGTLVSVTINMNSATTGLGVYGSNTGFTGYTSIPSQEGVSTIATYTNTAEKTITPTDAYKYVGITSSGDGVKQIASIAITWQSQVTYYTTAPGVLYEVNYELNGGAWAANEGCDDVHVKSGQTYTVCTSVPVRDGFKFVEWQVGGVAKSGEITISGNTTITAVWAAKASSKLTYNAGIGTGSSVVVSDVEEGTEITLPALGTGEGQINFSKEGFDFKGWKCGDKTYKVGATFIMPDADTTITAQWKKQNLEKMSLVASADLLVPGMEIVLANKDAAKVNGDIAAEKDFLASVSATFNNDNTVSYADNAGVVTLIVEKVENGWTLRKDASNYLKETKVKELAWVAENQASVWSITFDEGDAVITAVNPLRYNASSPRFTTYASGQGAIQIYGKANVISGGTSISDLGNMDNEVVVVPSGSTLTIDVPTEAISITAQAGSTVNIDEATTATSMIVENGATINVDDETTVTVNEVFHVQARRGQGNGDQPTTSSQINGASKVRVESPGYFDFTLAVSGETAANQWHDFSVPFPVDALNGVYGYKDNEWKKLTNEVDYAILDFHGDFRANGAYSWKKYSGELRPGKIYSLTVNGDIETFRFMKTEEAFTLESEAARYNYHNGSGENTRWGWNGLGNSKMDAVSIAGGIAKVYVLVYDANYPSGGYLAVDADKITLMIGSAFLIQTTANNTDVDFGPANSGEGTIYYAPRRAAAKEISEVKVTLSDGRYTDNLFLSASEDATNSYEIGKDLVKMFVTNTPAVPTLYTTNYNGTKLAAENAPLNGESVDYALTLFAPKAGEYTVAVEEPTDGTVYLTRNGSIIWNLSNGAYTMDMTQGSDASYGIRIVKAPNAATGCENINAGEAAQKVLLNNNVYILRNEQMYDVTGKAVK